MTDIKTAVEDLGNVTVDLNADGREAATENIQMATGAELATFRADVEVQTAEAEITRILATIRAGTASGVTEAELYAAVMAQLGPTPNADTRDYLLRLCELKDMSSESAFTGLDADDQFDADELLAASAPAATAPSTPVSLTGLETVFAASVQQYLSTKTPEEQAALQPKIQTSFNETQAFFVSRETFPTLTRFVNRWAENLTAQLDTPTVGRAGISMPNIGAMFGGGGTVGETMMTEMGILTLGAQYENFAAAQYEAATGTPPVPGSREYEIWLGRQTTSVEEAMAAGDRSTVEAIATRLESIGSTTDPEFLIDEYEAAIRAGLTQATYEDWKEANGYDGFMGLISAAGMDFGKLWAVLMSFLSIGGETEDIGQQRADALREGMREANDAETAAAATATYEAELTALAADDWANTNIDGLTNNPTGREAFLRENFTEGQTTELNAFKAILEADASTEEAQARSLGLSLAGLQAVIAHKADLEIDTEINTITYTKNGESVAFTVAQEEGLMQLLNEETEPFDAQVASFLAERENRVFAHFFEGNTYDQEDQQLIMDVFNHEEAYTEGYVNVNRGRITLDPPGVGFWGNVVRGAAFNPLTAPLAIPLVRSGMGNNDTETRVSSNQERDEKFFEDLEAIARALGIY